MTSTVTEAQMIALNLSRTHVIALIACASLACMLVTPGMVEAQSYTSILVLDPVPSSASVGDTITFSGQITTTSGHVVTGATIQIKDDVSFGRDRTIITVYTDNNGEFYASWMAQERSGAYDFYAVYEGTSNISGARSQTHSMTVSSYGTSNDYGSTRASSITLYGIPSSVYAGTQVSFSGQLTSNGQPLGGKFVMIYDDDPGPDDVLGYGWTNHNGYFSIPWIAEQGLVEVELEIYAVFNGDGDYERDRSANQEMSVVLHSGSITLDPLPPSAKVGQLITFSGTLSLDHGSPLGAVVYIKDEDFGSRDELLATGYVDGNGHFSASWIADYTDVNPTVDVFAVFEGNDEFRRLTTCGSPCASGTTQIRISGVVTPPTPPNPGSGEYIETYYSLDFDRSPRVAIMPDPDSYNNVKSHIIPAQEGVMMWIADLEREYGGNWDVTFEVVNPGERFDSRPDVIMNLVTAERKEKCQRDSYSITYGWASIYSDWNPYTAPKFSSPPKPINTTVCSTSGNERHPNAQVSATAAHEFIHAVGLGHTFNKPRDMMCSVEDDVPTCGSHSGSKSNTPSSLNLAGVAQLYGTDGFSNPNNNVAYRDRFYPDGSNPSPEPSTVPPPAPSSSSCERTDFTYDWAINEFELESGWFQWYTICGSPISYSFSTSSSYDGFSIYVLPPDTDVSDFVNNREGRYYVCEEPDSQWHRKSNTCNILPGSNIVLHNTMDDSIYISGWIRTPT